MFADYRVPQVLVHFGALKYSDELLKSLKSGLLKFKTVFFSTLHCSEYDSLQKR
jgi:hypothetical protein